MKKIFIVASALTLFFFSCGKKTNPVPPSSPGNPQNPTNPNNPKPTPTTSRFIPNLERDTLYGVIKNTQGQVIDYDSLIVYTNNDTSMLEYQGNKYYIWWASMAGIDTFENNAMFYINCQVATSPDTSSVFTSIVIYPHKYLDNWNTWIKQTAMLRGYNFHPTQKVENTIYTSWR